MLSHRGFSAWIVADEKALPEYLVAVDEQSHKVSCWIPSEAGQELHWQDHGGKVDTCGFITLDGYVVPGRFLFGEGQAFRQGVRTSVSSERPFMFQEIQSTEGQSALDIGAKDVGVVTLRIKRVERVSSRPANPIQNLPQSVLGKRKPGELRVGFGEETQAYDQYATTWSIKPYEPHTPDAKKASSYVSFVFRYRSRDFLESQGIATEQPAPLVLPAKRVQVRRVVSMPPTMPSAENPSLPPKKKPRLSNLGVGTQQPRHPGARRAVSYMAVPSRPESFPGEGIMMFHDETEHHQNGSDDAGGSSTETSESQFSPQAGEGAGSQFNSWKSETEGSQFSSWD